MGVHERGREEKKKKELEKFKKRQARKKQQNWQNGKYSPGQKPSEATPGQGENTPEAGPADEKQAESPAVKEAEAHKKEEAEKSVKAQEDQAEEKQEQQASAFMAPVKAEPKAEAVSGAPEAKAAEEAEKEKLEALKEKAIADIKEAFKDVDEKKASKSLASYLAEVASAKDKEDIDRIVGQAMAEPKLEEEEKKEETEGKEEKKESAKSEEVVQFTAEEKAKLTEAGISEDRIANLEKSYNALKDSYKREDFIAASIKASSNGQNLENMSREAQEIATRAAAGDEESTVGKDASNAVHGFVGVQAGGDLNLKLDSATGQEFKPIGGVKVYFQWFEKWTNGKEYTSPVYSTKSGDDGQFHLGIKPFLAPDGTLVQFDADTTFSAGNERYKFWIDETTIPEGYALQYITGESVVFPDKGLTITQGGSSSNTIKNTHNDWKVLLRKLPKNMHKDPTNTPLKSNTGGNITGNVSWDYSSGVDPVDENL